METGEYINTHVCVCVCVYVYIYLLMDDTIQSNHNCQYALIT